MCSKCSSSKCVIISVANSKYFIKNTYSKWRSKQASEQQARWAWHLVVLQEGFWVPSCAWLARGLEYLGSHFTQKENTLHRLFWFYDLWAGWSVRNWGGSLRLLRSKNQSMSYPPVWSLFRLKPCPGKGSDHSATRWRSKSFPGSFSGFFNRLVSVLVWQEGSGLRMPICHQHLSKACLSADREGFRETPPLKAHFLLCSCAGQGLGLRNSALDSLHRGAASAPGSDLCVNHMWAHKALRDCLGWS